MPLADVSLITYRSTGGWIKAIRIVVIAWLVVLATFYVLAVFDVTSVCAVGEPG